MFPPCSLMALDFCLRDIRNIQMTVGRWPCSNWAGVDDAGSDIGAGRVSHFTGNGRPGGAVVRVVFGVVFGFIGQGDGVYSGTFKG